jgi:hypothetical protein
LGRGQKIDIDNLNLEDLKEKTVENPGLISFPHNVSGAVIKPEDKGRIKGRAMMAMKEQTERQLQQLYEQMQTLVKQANDIKNRVHVSEKIYLSQMNFEPIIGQTYFLYEKGKGENIISMISPEEWGKSMPYQGYVAKVKLLADHTWEVLESGNQ